MLSPDLLCSCVYDASQKELQNLLSTHITVQVEVLFYHLGQCFSFADLFPDGFNVFVVLL